MHNTYVCRETFAKSLCISTKRVNTTMTKKCKGTPADNRGGKRDTCSLPAEVLQKIKDHLNAFPRYKSHYTRATSVKEFLNTETKMHEMYIEEGNCKVSLSTYKSIFIIILIYDSKQLTRPPAKHVIV